MKPENLGPRANKLYDDVVEAAELDAAGLLLLGEASRTLDIIERLTAATRSDYCEWLRLSEEIEELANGDLKVSLVINPLLGELRQQRMALKQLLAQLKLGIAKDRSASAKTKSAFDKIIESL